MAKDCLDSLEQAHLQWVGNYSKASFNNLVTEFITVLDNLPVDETNKLETIVVFYYATISVITMISHLVPLRMVYYEDGEKLIVESTKRHEWMFEGDWNDYDQWLETDYYDSLQLL